MLSADSGGGGGSDWAGMSIEMMRALIQNPSIESHYELLTGWQRSHELLSDHMTQVQSYRDNLATAWPPDKSAASSIYLARLDELIANLNETYEAAVANHDAFASATLSISLAQHDFEEVWQEHEANKAKLTEYQTDLAMSSAATFDTTPPVTSMQQEAVRQKAITLMSSVSADLTQAQARIVRPTAYQPPTMVEKDGKPNLGWRGTPPPLPLVVPTHGQSGTSTTSSSQPTTAFPTGSAQPGAATIPSTDPGVETPQPGLILGGTTPSVTVPPPAGVLPTTPSLPNGGAGGPVTIPGIPPLGVGSLVPRNSAPTRNSNGPMGNLPDESVVRSTAGSAGGVRSAPPGGLIGGPVGGVLGQPSAGRPSTRRVNPVGGMIGEGDSGTRAGARGLNPHSAQQIQGNDGLIAPGGRGSSATGNPSRVGRAGPSSESFYGQSTGPKHGQSGKTDSSRWDPDNPWETAEGVAPVLLPPRERPVDPGPVIGLR